MCWTKMRWLLLSVGLQGPPSSTTLPSATPTLLIHPAILPATLSLPTTPQSPISLVSPTSIKPCWITVQTCRLLQITTSTMLHYRTTGPLTSIITKRWPTLWTAKCRTSSLHSCSPTNNCLMAHPALSSLTPSTPSSTPAAIVTSPKCMQFHAWWLPWQLASSSWWSSPTSSPLVSNSTPS